MDGNTGKTGRIGLVAALVLTLVAFTVGCGSSDDGSSGGTTAMDSQSDTAGSSEEAGLSPDSVAAVEGALEDWVAEGNAPGVMVQVKTPTGTWSDVVGVADKEASTPMSLDLQHRIGSVTKSFATTLILQLVEEGKLDLDDPVSKYVDGIPRGGKITIRQLGDMTAGLPEYLGNDEFREAFFADPTRPLTPDELLAASFATPNNFPPGASSSYSNANTVVLGLVAESIEGKPFGEILEEKILEPYDLDHTEFPADAEFSEGHTSGYSTLDPNHDEIESTTWTPTQAFSAGQMTSTVGDLTRWAEILGTGEAVRPELQAERMRWEAIGDNNDEWHYTFGIEENSGWLGHNGMIPGYMTYVVYHPKLETSIVLVQNTDRNVNDEPGINPLLRKVSTLLFPNNPVNVPVIG